MPRGTLRNSRPRLLTRLPLPIPTPLKLSLLARAPVCPRLRPRCCCCCCCCRPVAVGTPYERRQSGDCTQKLQVTVSAAVESLQTGFNSLIIQHVRFNRALTPLFYLVPRCQVSRCQLSRFQPPYSLLRRDRRLVYDDRDTMLMTTILRCFLDVGYVR